MEHVWKLGILQLRAQNLGPRVLCFICFFTQLFTRRGCKGKYYRVSKQVYCKWQKKAGEKTRGTTKIGRNWRGTCSLKEDTLSFYKNTMKQTKQGLMCLSCRSESQTINEMYLTNMDLKIGKVLEFTCDLLFSIRALIQDHSCSCHSQKSNSLCNVCTSHYSQKGARHMYLPFL